MSTGYQLRNFYLQSALKGQALQITNIELVKIFLLKYSFQVITLNMKKFMLSADYRETSFNCFGTSRVQILGQIEKKDCTMVSRM